MARVGKAVEVAAADPLLVPMRHYSGRRSVKLEGAALSIAVEISGVV